MQDEVYGGSNPTWKGVQKHFAAKHANETIPGVGRYWDWNEAVAGTPIKAAADPIIRFQIALQRYLSQ
jgi:hypothetical protein